MARGPEKRKTPRIQPFVLPCRVLSGRVRTAGFLVELSVHGARVSTEGEPPSAGVSAILEVRLGKRVAHSKIPAEVQWVRAHEGEKGRHDFGLTFRDVGIDDQKLLEAIVEEFRHRAAQLA
ncbi:MAG TPA: PilZ domain-containing protein [Vicinamibacteria bacterium]|jgi:hypothetical protein|nr:PilZ domain-containing protein [Vicinamibacteria bacterium]